MIVQAGRSISGLNDRRARPTSRSLNYPTRPHTQSKIQTFSGQSWCCVGRRDYHKPTRRHKSSIEAAGDVGARCRRLPSHSFHLEGIVRAQWESGRWVAAPQALLSVWFCRHLLTELTLVIFQPASVDSL